MQIDAFGGESANAHDVEDKKWDKTFLRGDASQKDYLIHRYHFMKNRSYRLVDRFLGYDCFCTSSMLYDNTWPFHTHGGLFRLGGIE